MTQRYDEKAIYGQALFRENEVEKNLAKG